MGCSSSRAFKALAEATRSNSHKVCLSSFRSSLVENGYFSFVPVHKGYWGFAALGAGGELKHNGKELSQDAVLWIEAK